MFHLSEAGPNLDFHPRAIGDNKMISVESNSIICACLTLKHTIVGPSGKAYKRFALPCFDLSLRQCPWFMHTSLEISTVLSLPLNLSFVL